MNRHAETASRLAKVSGYLFLIFTAIFFFISMITPITVTLNDYTTQGRLWELASEPGPFIFLLIMLAIPLVLGIIALIISKKVKTHPTKLQGIFLIAAGIASVVFLVGIIFIVAGVQTLLAKQEQDFLHTEND